MMKKSSILSKILLFCVFFLVSARVEASPQFQVIGAASFDFGDVRANETLTHTFTFKNTGDSTLSIEQAKGGWGCTVSLLSSSEIPPGGEGKLEVKLRSGSRRRHLRQTVKVQTNDPQNASVVLTVAANVLVDLDVVPNLLRFDLDPSGQAVVKVKNYTDHTVTLHHITSSNQYVLVSVSSQTIPPYGEILVTGNLIPDAPKGILSGWVTLQTDLQTLPVIQIRLWANLR